MAIDKREDGHQPVMTIEKRRKAMECLNRPLQIIEHDVFDGLDNYWEAAHKALRKSSEEIKMLERINKTLSKTWNTRKENND